MQPTQIRLYNFGEMSILTPFFIFFISVFSTLVFSLITKRFGPTWGLMDIKKGDRGQTKGVPLGGVALFSGFLMGVVPFLDLFNQVLPLLLGAVVMVSIGLIDDLLDLAPKVKLSGQLVGALIPVVWGVRVLSVDLGFANLSFGFLSIPLTLFWIIGVTNALNLIDGLDGLAAGGCVITASFLAIFAGVSGNWGVFLLSIALIGSCIGFLKFNRHPAQLILGDSGSYFLGFALSIMTLGYSSIELYQLDEVPLLVAMSLIALPIIDTTWAIIRRLKKRENILQGDQQHIHHQLLKRMKKYKKTVFVLHTIWLLFCILGTFFYFN